MYAAEPLPHFVEDYLAYLREVHPTAATFDGFHVHDDLVEDFSRSGLEQHSRELGGFSRRLENIRTDTLTDSERIERPVLDSNIRARLFDLDDVRTWERDPRVYAETLAISLAAQTLFRYASSEDRARRVLSKLRQTPKVVDAARTNVKEPPGIFVKAAVEVLRGLSSFIERDLPRAFADVDDMSLLSDLADASTEATTAVQQYAELLEQEVGPKTKGSFRLGPARFLQKLKLEEGIDLPVDKLLDIANRELGELQDAFRAAASKLGTGDPLELWRQAKQQHPTAGDLVKTAQSQVQQLAQFIDKKGLVSVPDADGLVVAPTPRFYRWTFASLWAPGPFEAKPLKAFYYLTDVDPSWPAERQAEHMRDFNHGALWAISCHEAFPGHYLHTQHLRRVEGSLRKSMLLGSLSFIEGWAHYSEQLMVEQGFGKKDPLVRLGQLSEALIRIVRLIVGIKLHAEDLSVEQGVRLFREEAYLEESSARREAERGTFDPSYVVYALGRLMLLKLRRDAQNEAGENFSLQAFHDKLLGNGLLPFPAHRRLMLRDASGPLLG
ncbi:MAG: DUF885 domain-containing protein [Vicinamibacterales bacterium]